MNEILYLLIAATSSVVSLFIIAKLLGKRQIAQLEFVDYVIGISIGSISAEMATDINDKPLYYYLIAIFIYYLFDLLINFFGRKTPLLKNLLKGKPIVLIYEGKINYKNLKKSRLSVNDMLSLAREQGYFNILDIYYAILENSGTLSVVPVAQQKPVVVADVNVKPKTPTLPYYLVCDGKVSASTLKELKKDGKWLYNKLNIKSKKELKNIIFAVYNLQTRKVDIHYKT